MADKQSRLSRRTIALLWCLAVIVLVGTLIYSEQIALLYVLATLVIVALLLVVGNADLKGVSRDNAGFAVDDEKV